MSRWHESGCRRPDVSTISGIPCCNYCFALPPLLEDDGTHIPDPPTSQLPRLRDRNQMNLTWPSVVSYGCGNLSSHDDEMSPSPPTLASTPTPTPTSRGESQAEENDGDQSSLAKSEPQKTTFLPAITSHHSIRLLRLRPAPADSPIHADIEAVHLRSPSLPIYEALSYTWADDSGDSTRCCPIFLGEYWDVAYVTRNCEEALRAIRPLQGDRLLWVDSLCINQENSDEKTRQVGLIHEIYSKASKVVAYLGGESPESSKALNFLQETAAAGPLMPDYPPAINRDFQRSLQLLFQRPYFSRLWVVQEVLLARELEIVCGKHSVSWPKGPCALTHSNSHIPSWMLRDQSWYGFTGQDLLQILLNASPYKCSDPRDKVFAVLGLIYENDISPDYRLPVENVYTGVAAYLIKRCHSMDILALAGINKKKAFDVPSWVPDWSQQLAPPLLKNLLDSEDDTGTRDRIARASTRVVFDGILDSDHGIQINADTGSMQIHAVKLCDISGQISRAKDYTHISMPRGPRGTFIVTLPDQTYQIGTDSLFLLSGWDQPVILRLDPNSDSDSYLLVSACVLSFGPSSSHLWHSPWRKVSMYSKQDGIKVSVFSQEDNSRLLELHSRLAESCRVPPTSSAPQDTITIPFSTARDRMLTFFLLSLTPLRKIETRLRNTWDQLNHKLGWMFSDHAATWKLMQEIQQGNVEPQSGEARMKLELFEPVWCTKYCGVEFPPTYRWDLGRFCSSFLRPTVVPGLAAAEEIWSPVFDELMSHLPEIRTWAETTEQLFQVFEYTRIILGDSWISFPGSQLLQDWLRHYENFCHAVGQSLQQQEQHQRPQLDASCLWDWAEFEDHLRARARLWDQKVPRELDPSVNRNVAAHMGLKTLGLELYNERMIQIR